MVKKHHTRHASHHYHRNHTRRAPQAVALPKPSRFSSLSPGGGKQWAKKSPPSGGQSVR